MKTGDNSYLFIRVLTYNNLGCKTVTFQDGRWGIQPVAEAKEKTNHMIGNIRKYLDYLNLASFPFQFKSMVRPILEYAHSVWKSDEKNEN